MLVEHRVDLDGGGVQPGLVREGGHAHVGLVGVRRHVGDLADRMRDPAHLRQAPIRQHLAALLQLQPRHDAEQVRVAAPLAVAVRGALHVGDARVHRRQGVGHRAGGVIVAVDAQPRPCLLPDGTDHVAKFARQHAAVGVAERHDVGARVGRHAHHFKRVRRVGAVAVEEMLRVEEHPPALRAQVRDGVADHREVLRQGGAEGQLDVPVVTLGDKSHDRRAGFAQRGDRWVVGRLGAGPAGRAERGELRVLQVKLGPGEPEEFRVLGVGARPSALDETGAELIKLPRDGQLVGHRQIQALLLCPIAQRCVVDMERVVEHRLCQSLRVP